MKILLIRPPARCVKGGASPSAGLPLGLLYIAAVLEKSEFTVEIYDAQINVHKPISHDLDGNMHMGDSWEVVEEEIRKRNPGLIGITNPFTTQFDNAVRVAEIVKRVNKEIPVVVGGNHPTVNPEDFFRRTGAVDIVCMGEGEYTMLEIADAWREQRELKDIPGTAVREGNQVKINQHRGYIQNLDILPFPAYHLINLENYFFLNKMGFDGRPVCRYPGFERAVSVITSRGCPFNCIFCSIHLHMGKKWRGHSSEYVLKHLRFLVDKYNVKHIHFEDDNLTLNPERFKEIIDDLLESKINIIWDTPNGIRADTMTKELLEKSKESGCSYIILGIESGDQRVLSEIINKKLELTEVIRVATWCKAVGLDTMAFFVIGFPGETLTDMKKTVDFALNLMKNFDVLPAVFMATPLLGTRLYEICKENGYLRRELTSNNLAIVTGSGGKESLIETEDFNHKEIAIIMRRFMKGYKIIFLRNFLRFIMETPCILPDFIKKVWSLKQDIGLKQAFIELASFKNCFRRKFSIRD